VFESTRKHLIVSQSKHEAPNLKAITVHSPIKIEGFNKDRLSLLLRIKESPC